MYRDSSALLKLLVDEAESAEMAAFVLARVRVPLVSSELATVAVVRAVRRLAPEAVSDPRALLSQIDLIPLSSEVLARACDVAHPMLRTLDALHLASAEDSYGLRPSELERLHAAIVPGSGR